MPNHINEMQYAKTLVPAIPDHSLTVFDKGFLAAEILCGLTANGQNRHFLIPAKGNTKWEVIEGTPEDAIVQMRVSPQARTKSPTLPEYWRARAITVIDPQGRIGRQLRTYRNQFRARISYHPVRTTMGGCHPRARETARILQRLRKRLVALLNEKRPGRMCDRVGKAKPRRYAVRVLKKVLI